MKALKIHRIINIDDMKDGEIGVIVDWLYEDKIEFVVQRYYNNLICLGKPGGKGWTGFFDSKHKCRHKVEILISGDSLILD